MAEGGSITRNDKSCNVSDLGMGDTSNNSYQPEKRNFYPGGPKSMNDQNGQNRVANLSGATHDRVDSELTNSPIPQRLRNESLSQSNQSSNLPADVESDAVPVTPSPLVNDNAKDKLNYLKASEMHGNGNNTLRLENQIEDRLSGNDLFDVVIVFAKPDYEKALEYQQWLRSIAAKANINDIKVELYTGISFTDNDVQIAEEVVNKSMRVVMLLSESFTKEECLRFFKEETIGLTRLHICPSDEQISCFGSAIMTVKNIMKTKKDFIRIVHTCPQAKRSYTTPVGLTALRPYEFFNDNPNQSFEDGMAKQFLQKTRSDRNEFQRHQPIDDGKDSGDYIDTFSRMGISSMSFASASSSNVTMGKKSTFINGNQNITNIYNQVTPGEKKSEENLTSGDTKPLSHYVAVATIGKCVGYLYGPKISGTCWRVGEDKIITAFHVVAGNIRNPAHESGSYFQPWIAKMLVDFNYLEDKKSDESKCFRLHENLLYYDEKLDVAVLQLKCNDNLPFPPPIKMFDEITPEIHSDQEICLVSHDKGNSGEVNSDIGLYNPTEQKMKELQKYSEEFGEPNGYDGLDDKDKLVIKCKFGKISSGCPGFTIGNDGKPRVVLLYLKGYPYFYYSQRISKEKKEKIPQDKVLQQGLGIFSLYRALTDINISLRDEIFPNDADIPHK